ncbi:hypothetical protein B296_00024628, partial [Ensete ventricosum]
SIGLYAGVDAAWAVRHSSLLEATSPHTCYEAVGVEDRQLSYPKLAGMSWLGMSSWLYCGDLMDSWNGGCLAAFDDDKVCSYYDTTRLHEERVADLIFSSGNCVGIDVDGGGRRGVYGEDGGRFAIDSSSGTVDLKYELEHLIILTASRCLLGREVRDKLFDDVSALFHDLDNGMRPISVIFPYLPIPAHRRRDRARARIAEIFSTIIKSRKSSGKSEDDMLQCFIDSRYKDGRPTTEGEITGLLIAALFAGQHTSSITSTWTGAYMLRYQKYLTAALEEQREIMRRHGDKVDHDILSEMDVLYRCIKEALRLHPPLIMLLRYSHDDFTIATKDGNEYDIPKGHIVATSPAFANRLPYIYKDPDTYDPDRFTPGRDEDKAAGAFSYISFGGGRHGCLGEPFAYLQIKAIWSHLLRNFEFELISPFPENDWNAMVVGVKGEVMVRYKRHKLSIDN